MDPTLRPTPETDAMYFKKGVTLYELAGLTKQLERQRDEAREIANKYEDRYFTMSELRNNASIVALEYKSQRDRLLEALKRVLASATPNPRDNPAMYPVWESARKAIAEVKGGR